MQTNIKNTIITFALAILASSVSISLAQQTPILPEESTSADDANTVSAPSFPYLAEITGSNVNIRSGPGTNYYRCGKLSKADRVEVVSRQFSWSRIVPPVGSFSWISMQYVSVSLDNPTVGIVTGDNVRVYAGSDYVKPMHSTSLQLKLNRGDKIKLLGEEKDDYYKIAPPTGAYLWVSTKYTNPIESVDQALPTAGSTADANAVVPAKPSTEAEMLEKYYVLQKQIEAERAKPISQQDYSDIKNALTEIADNKAAGKAARYTEFAIKQIERFELALAVAKELQLQDEQLQKIKQRIDKARAARLAEVEELGRFTVVGQFQGSIIYDAEQELKRYRIIDEAGRTACYVVPIGPALKMDLSRFIDRKVGLVGTIEPHLPTVGALVRFTEIVELGR